MAEQLYREKSMDRISSPEQLNDYLKVTKTTVWVVLIAIILLLAGFFVWAALTYIGSNVSGTGEVKGGRTMVISFDDDADAAKVEEGMEVKAGDGSAVITRVGGEGALRCRLLDMGLIPKTRVCVTKVAPLGDPIELRLRDYSLSIRLEDARQIEVSDI